MFTWLANTLRAFPEIAIFLALAIGYAVGNLSYRSFSIGAVTATLIIALAIGQLGIAISPTVKATFFLLFLFAVGYGIGPQFVRSVAKDGWAQASLRWPSAPSIWRLPLSLRGLPATTSDLQLVSTLDR